MVKILFKFFDGVYFVSNKSFKIRGKCFVKWLDGHCYEAVPITSNDNENMLNHLAYNLNNNWPRVYLCNSSELINSPG